jgi:hypothetical protein
MLVFVCSFGAFVFFLGHDGSLIGMLDTVKEFYSSKNIRSGTDEKSPHVCLLVCHCTETYIYD